MPLWLPPCTLGLVETNLTAADKDGGTVTTSGTAHVKGAYTELIAASAEDAYGITVSVSGIHVSATATNYLIDLSIGPAASEVVVIEDLDVASAPTIATEASAQTWFFPLFIPKGSRVAARGQALIVSDTCNVAIWLHQAAGGWGMEAPAKWERLGAVTDSSGVSVTPGSGAFGAWTTILDPITKNYRWWHASFDYLGDASQGAAGHALVEVGIGDTTAAVTTIGSWTFALSTVEAIGGPYPPMPVFQPLVDDDAKGVFARISSTATEARGVLVYAAE